MSTGTLIGLFIVGMAAGMLSSMVGIGGGIVVVPAMVILFGVSQKMAQGTSLAMLLPPIGILAVINYYKAGFIDFRFAAVLCISFVIGGYLGSKLALSLSETLIKKIFAVFLMIVAIKYFFDK